MPVVPLRELLNSAQSGGYGIPAVNVFDATSMDAVLHAAVRELSPIIIQTSVKTVKTVGVQVLAAMWEAMTWNIPVPVTLHLDHCPDQRVISSCIANGWNSVLFDGSGMSEEDNTRIARRVVREAHAFGVDVEGELDAIRGVEDGVGVDDPAPTLPLGSAIAFIEHTGIDVFAPAIGNAHGRYLAEPRLDVDRVRALHRETRIPLALHGGSGIARDQLQVLIEAGCSKINVSTAIKEAYMQASLQHLRSAELENRWDPPSLFADIQSAIHTCIGDLCHAVGSAGRA